MIMVPKPWQELQVASVMTLPRMERMGRWIWPLPWQTSQVVGEVPGRQQLPSHVGQVMAVSISSFLLTPNTASRRSIAHRDEGILAAAGA